MTRRPCILFRLFLLLRLAVLVSLRWAGVCVCACVCRSSTLSRRMVLGNKQSMYCVCKSSLVLLLEKSHIYRSGHASCTQNSLRSNCRGCLVPLNIKKSCRFQSLLRGSAFAQPNSVPTTATRGEACGQRAGLRSGLFLLCCCGTKPTLFYSCVEVFVEYRSIACLKERRFRRFFQAFTKQNLRPSIRTKHKRTDDKLRDPSQ